MDTFDDSSTFQRLALSLKTRLERVQTLPQETTFFRVADTPGGEHPAKHDASRLELVHVLQDEDLHLFCPERDRRIGDEPLELRGIASRERQVVQPMLGKERGVSQRRPAA